MAIDSRSLPLAAAGLRSIWSARAANRVRQLLRVRPVDVVHVHNLFPMLSPSVLQVTEAEGVATVATLHNYRLLCLPATFLRQGHPCEDCLGRTPWPGVLHKCYRSSSAASAALATSLSFHRALGTFRGVALYLAVSEFLRAKHLQAGFPRARIIVKPNFAWSTERRNGPGRYFLYLGRLSEEKGLKMLLQAWEEVAAPLVVAGEGPDSRYLRSVASDNVRWLGLVNSERARELVRAARALILPSISYEGAPRSIPEAYAAGVPVIASRFGGIPELVQESNSGVLVPAGDIEALRLAVSRLLDNRESLRLGEGAFRLWLKRLTPEQGLQALEKSYATAMERSQE
jgi:glycosyltransferase involved in cell wall biosynthesis